MNQEEVIIRGKKFLLSERASGDVHALVEYYLKGDREDYLFNISLDVQMISDSLKNSYKYLPFYKKPFYKKLHSQKFLLNFLTENERKEMCNKVNALEGNDKKKVMTENQSQGLSETPS